MVGWTSRRGASLAKQSRAHVLWNSGDYLEFWSFLWAWTLFHDILRLSNLFLWIVVGWFKIVKKYLDRIDSIFAPLLPKRAPKSGIRLPRSIWDLVLLKGVSPTKTKTLLSQNPRSCLGISIHPQAETEDPPKKKGRGKGGKGGEGDKGDKGGKGGKGGKAGETNRSTADREWFFSLWYPMMSFMSLMDLPNVFLFWGFESGLCCFGWNQFQRDGCTSHNRS